MFLVGDIFKLLCLELLLQDKAIDLVVIVFSLFLLDLILGMKALIKNGFKFWADVKVGQDIVHRTKNVLIVIGKHLDQDLSIIVKHLCFRLQVELHSVVSKFTKPEFLDVKLDTQITDVDISQSDVVFDCVSTSIGDVFESIK